jgi:hypothetical protein
MDAGGAPETLLSIHRQDRMRRDLAVILFLCVLAAGTRGQTVPFAQQVIDPANSGDCKALGDIDGDGKADPIIGGSSLCWYESGAGFAKHIIRADPVYSQFTTDIQAVDVDGDGDIDIVIGDGSGDGNILWFENPRINPPAGMGNDPRDGSNWVMHIIGTHGDTVHDIEVADLDNDGKLDVVTSGHNFTHVWKQVNGDTWIDIDLSAMAGAGVFLGDIDRDGFKDIATPWGWIKNPQDLVNGEWVFYPIDQAITGDECLLVDLDGDGRLDLVTCDAHSRADFVWFQQPLDPTSSEWSKQLIDPSMGAHHPEAADFNHDGRMDILAGLELEDLSIYINLGGSPPTFQKQQLAQCCGHNARVGDINGDGLPDILACGYIGNPPVEVFINALPPPCPANCDGSTAPPVLNANDFQCFMNKFAAGDPAANCDHSTGIPILNANDFQCFVNQFAAGCP